MNIKILKFRPHERNTLKGFVNVLLADVGLEIRDICLHQALDSNRRWINLPSRSYQKDDGTLGWSYVVTFEEKETYWQFTNSVLRELDKQEQEEDKKEPEIKEDEIPF